TLDKHLIDNALAVHSGSGLCVLARPDVPEDSARVTKLGLGRLLAVLTRQFDYLVIDSVMSVEPVYATAIGIADVNLLVIQLNVPPIRNAERFMAAIRRMEGVDARTVKLVVNRYDRRNSEITPEDASKALGMKLEYLIPNDFKTAIGAINYGQPVVLRSPRADVSTSYGQLVQMLNGRTH